MPAFTVRGPPRERAIRGARKSATRRLLVKVRPVAGSDATWCARPATEPGGPQQAHRLGQRARFQKLSPGIRARPWPARPCPRARGSPACHREQTQRPLAIPARPRDDEQPSWRAGEQGRATATALAGETVPAVELDEARRRHDPHSPQAVQLLLVQNDMFCAPGADRLDQASPDLELGGQRRWHTRVGSGDHDRVERAKSWVPSVPSPVRTTTLPAPCAVRLRRACAARSGQMSMLITRAASRASSAVW